MTSKLTMEERIAAINADVEKKSNEAVQLLDYLNVQREKALLDEAVEEEELKRKGIVIGQHVPSLKSRLDIDSSKVAAFETFAPTLLVASDLVGQNKTNFLRRTGNLPISDIAAAKKLQNEKRKAETVTDDPNYTLLTKSAKWRDDRVKDRFSDSLNISRSLVESRRLEMSMTGEAKPPRKQKKVLSALERDANEEVLKGINHKLNYLRNPRNDPSAVTRMLVKSKRHFQPGYSATLDDATDAAGAVSSGKTVTTSLRTLKTEKKKWGKADKIMNNPLFTAEPKTVFFSDYEAKQTYTQKLVLRNDSSITRSLRVIPPTSVAFSIAPLKFPPNCNGGMVAPGMSVSTVVTFIPPTLGDFKDMLQIETESGNFDVNLAAQREPPNLSIPSTLDVGCCLVGDAMRVSITCQNTGGGARFLVLTPEEHDAIAGNTNAVGGLSKSEQMKLKEEGTCMRLAPFTLYPVDFTLMKNEAVDLSIEFVPLDLSFFHRQFYVWCDNGQIRKFVLQGESRQLRTVISEINHVEFDFTDPNVFPDVCFPPAYIGSEQSQQLLVVNDTGLPVEYEWVWLDLDCQDLGREARNKVFALEQERTAATLIEGGSVGDYSGKQAAGDSLSAGAGAGVGAGSGKASVRASSVTQGSKAPGTASGAVTIANVAPEESLMDSPEKRKLLQGLQMTMDGHASRGTSGVLENRASVGGFDISPARGVLPGEGAETFTLSFTPVSSEPANKRAVMVIKTVPCAALPGPQQQTWIRQLKEQGHGRNLRCRSWLEDLGTLANVEPFLRENGSPTSSKYLVNLQTLVQLVVTHALNDSSTADQHGIDHTDFDRISRWTRSILKYVDGFRKVEMVTIDDNSTDGGASVAMNSITSESYHVDRPITKDGIHYYISVYDWNPESERAGGELLPPVPVPLPHLKLSTCAHADADDLSDSNEEAGPPSLRDFTEAQRALMGEIWMDSCYCVAVLGERISELLDCKVKHECVEFIKECALTHLAGPHVAVYGEGRYQSIELDPPRVTVGGLLSVGQDWMGSFKLVNHSAAPAEVKVLKKRISTQRRFSQHALDSPAALIKEAHTDHEDASSVQTGPDDTASAAAEKVASLLLQGARQDQVKDIVAFDCEYEDVLVMPHSEACVKFSLTVNSCGRYLVKVPLLAKSRHTSVDDLLVDVHVVGPKLRFDAAEVDLGLIGVGNEGRRSLTFVNESDVPAMFMMKPQLHLDISAGKKSASGNNTQRSSSQGGQGTSRGNLSRMSTARSDDFSVADSQASSNGDFKIDLKNAAVSIEPSTGVVAAGQSFSVDVVCKTGKIPQRIRGMIESRVLDISGTFEGARQCLNMRGEVQAPKTKMYPLLSDLGLVYVGRPVNFTIHIENMCNLPTIYKLLRPGGESSLYKLKFDKHKGSLDAKEIVTVNCTFTAVAPGLIDDIISNKIFGAKVPLAFIVKAKSKGVSLEFVGLAEGEEPPEPLAAPTAMQLPNEQKPPEPRPTEPLLVGDEVPLYKRRQVKFYLRNLSAIPVPFVLRPRKYTVQPKPERFGRRGSVVGSASHVSSVLESQAASIHRDDLILGPHEGGMEKFQSAAGKEYLGSTVYRQEDRVYLYSGLGAAYHLDVKDGELPPWGVQVVTVSAYNDIPGCYDDEIECEIVEGEITKSFLIPIEMSVIGCPMVIEKDTVGMTVYPRKGEQVQLVGKPMLQLGNRSVNAEPLMREFYVKNHGSKEGKVRWQVKSLTSKANGPIKVSLKMQEPSGHLLPVVKFWDDLAKDSPFVVEPNFANIPPYGKKKFKVTLFRTENEGTEVAQLTGTVSFQQGDLEDHDSSIASVGSAESMPSAVVAAASTGQSIASASKASAAANQKFTLELLLQGTFQFPTVQLDRMKLVATDSPTVLPDVQAIIMKAKAPLLFEHGARAADLCNKQITLLNPSEARLLFSVSTEGPFTVRELGAVKPAPPAGDLESVVDVEATQQKALEQRDLLAAIANSSTASVGSKALIGKLFNLYPNEFGSFQLDFNPRKDLKEKLVNKFGTEAGMPTEQRGKLVLTYSTGQSLHLPLITRISTPFLAGSAPRMYFGVCHTHEQTAGVLLLTNPTDVPARWTVAHVPGQGAWRRQTAIRVRGFDEKPEEVDDPEVFEISPDNGIVEGPTVSVTAAIAAPPVDLNRRTETIVPQRTVKTSWAANTLTMKDSLELRHRDQRSAAQAEACYPLPINVHFRPKKNVHYSSRFRFSCAFANSFDLVLQGEGTYEEHLHKPLTPMPKTT